MGARPAASGPLDEIYLLRIFRARQHDGAARGVAVAVQILGHRVDHDVRAKLDRPLQVGTEKRVVHHDRHVAFVGQLATIAAMSVTLSVGLVGVSM